MRHAKLTCALPPPLVRKARRIVHRSGLVCSGRVDIMMCTRSTLNCPFVDRCSPCPEARGREGALRYTPAARNFFYYSMFQGNNGLDRERNGEWYAFRVRHLRCKRTVKGHGTCSIPPTACEFVNPTTKYTMCARTAKHVFLITRFCFSLLTCPYAHVVMLHLN